MQQLRFVILSFLFSCFLTNSYGQSKQAVDLILINAKVYTVDSTFSTVESFAVKNGKILETGTTKKIQALYTSTNIIDVKNKFVYPGLIDGHCHFYHYGLNLAQVDLFGTKSFNEVIERVQKWAIENPSGWILGLGWDQNDWKEKSFPDNKKLNELFPDRPLLLARVDGHAAIANDKALSLAHITFITKLEGGTVILGNDKNPTGVLVDNAYDLVKKYVPVPTTEEKTKAFLKVEKLCMDAGLTTIDDAGLDKNDILFIDSLQKKGIMKMRMYAMISDTEDNLEYFFSHGKIKTDRLNVRSIKLYADGALGSRGACLLRPYSDAPDQYGFLLSKPDHFIDIAKKAFDKGFQVNTHCIGDSANRLIINIYKNQLKGKNNLRWRIEHVQVITKRDIKELANNSIIPSVQPSHATSDMPWAETRIGTDRINNAYSYKDLLDACGTLCIGSDFPVESYNPIIQFYAAVSRKDANGNPASGFLPEQKITREQALKGLTIWSAYANFEEKEKGSIEAGKFADFIISDTDLMSVAENEILKFKVLNTFINGEKVK